MRLGLPVTFDPERVVAGASFPCGWNSGCPVRIGPLPRAATRVVWCEEEPCDIFHMRNTSADAGVVACDVVRLQEVFANDPLGPDGGPSTPVRRRIDPVSGRVREVVMSRVGLEPVFVPRIPDVTEDDGWVLTYVYDASTGQSDVMILSARDSAGNPVAARHPPSRSPFGCHGSWLPDEAPAPGGWFPS